GHEWPEFSAGALWSLWAMLTFMAWQLIQALQLLRELESEAAVACANGHRDQPVPAARITTFARGAVTYCEQQAQRIELSAALARASHVVRDLNTGLTWDQLRCHAKVLRETMQDDLTYRVFAYVPLEKAKVLRGLSSTWEPVWGQFPSIKEDSSEAVECYALGRNTACVFHLMRVAERG